MEDPYSDAANLYSENAANPYYDAADLPAESEETAPAEAEPKEAAPTFDVAAVRWLRSRRAMVRSSEQLADFKQELTELGADIENRKGATVAQAIGMTVVAIALALLMIGLGVLLMDIAGAWLGSMAEGS